eukprot:sb/3464274/
MSGCSRSTQTDLNVELLINFLKFDLPRMISNDIVPIVYKAVAESKNGDICKDIQQLITRLIAENLPTSKPLPKCLIAPTSRGNFIVTPNSDYRQRKKLTPACPVCHWEFATFPEMTAHIHSKHGDQQAPVMCSLCNKDLPNCKELATHLEGHMFGQVPDEIMFPCKICSVNFTTTSMLDKHMKSHRRSLPGTPNVCSTCSQVFAHASQLKSHKQFSLTCGNKVGKTDQPSNDQNTKLQLGTASIVTSALNKALGLSTPATPVDTIPAITAPLITAPSIPPVPVKSEAFEPHLLPTGINLVSTAAGRKLQCQKCNRSFTTLSILTKHMEDHDAVKAFSCTRCHHRFKTYSALDSHFHRVHRTNKKRGEELVGVTISQPESVVNGVDAPNDDGAGADVPENGADVPHNDNAMAEKVEAEKSEEDENWEETEVKKSKRKFVRGGRKKKDVDKSWEPATKKGLARNSKRVRAKRQKTDEQTTD